MKFYEVEFEDGFSIAIKGTRMPTVEEAEHFCQYKYAKAVNVLEITEEEARNFFDCSKIDDWPVFNGEGD